MVILRDNSILAIIISLSIPFPNSLPCISPVPGRYLYCFCYQTRVGLLLGELKTETTPGGVASQSPIYLF